MCNLLWQQLHCICLAVAATLKQRYLLAIFIIKHEVPTRCRRLLLCPSLFPLPACLVVRFRVQLGVALALSLSRCLPMGKWQVASCKWQVASALLLLLLPQVFLCRFLRSIALAAKNSFSTRFLCVKNNIIFFFIVVAVGAAAN